MQRIRSRAILAAALAGVFSVSGWVRAGTISESATAPTVNVLTSQLIDLGPGAEDSDGDYTDNSGPVGETFHISTAANITAITIQNNGDSQTDPTLNFHFEIGTFNTTTGLITQLQADTAPESITDNSSNFITFTFANPIAATAGSNYEFSIWSETKAGNGGNWLGLAHSAPGTHPGDGGESFNYDVSTTNHDNNADGLGKNGGWATPGYVAPNVNNYEYVFAIQGTAVPEPATASLVVLGVMGLLKRRRS